MELTTSKKAHTAIKDAADQIYYTYVAWGSPYEVNVSASSKQLIRDTLHLSADSPYGRQRQSLKIRDSNDSALVDLRQLPSTRDEFDDVTNVEVSPNVFDDLQEEVLHLMEHGMVRRTPVLFLRLTCACACVFVGVLNPDNFVRFTASEAFRELYLAATKRAEQNMLSKTYLQQE